MPMGVRPPLMTISYPEGQLSPFGTWRMSMDSTTFWLPMASAHSLIRAGRATAAELTLIFSAPARRRSVASATERTPPPTDSGMNTSLATASTTSSMMARLSLEAVMS